jgi:predicted RNase H-like nuclease
MTVVAGADGCRRGWICLRKDLQTALITADLYQTAHALIHHGAALVILQMDGVA